MELESILKIIDRVSASPISRFDLETDGFKIKIKKASEPPETVVQCQTAGETGLAAQENQHEVLSPMVGTFYTSPSPDASPFISVGDHVKKGQVIGIIEAMKLMNEVESDVDGEVTAIVADNQATVEFGQPLIVVVPSQEGADR